MLPAPGVRSSQAGCAGHVQEAPGLREGQTVELSKGKALMHGRTPLGLELKVSHQRVMIHGPLALTTPGGACFEGQGRWVEEDAVQSAIRIATLEFAQHRPEALEASPDRVGLQPVDNWRTPIERLATEGSVEEGGASLDASCSGT